MRNDIPARHRLTHRAAALRTLAAASALSLGLAGGADAQQSAPEEAAPGAAAEAWINAQQPPRAESDEGGLKKNLRSLRQDFASWWNQPPGPSANNDFVRERAEKRQQLQERAALLEQRVVIGEDGKPLPLAPIPRVAPRAAVAAQIGAPLEAPIPQNRAAGLETAPIVSEPAVDNVVAVPAVEPAAQAEPTTVAEPILAERAVAEPIAEPSLDNPASVAAAPDPEQDSRAASLEAATEAALAATEAALSEAALENIVERAAAEGETPAADVTSLPASARIETLGDATPEGGSVTGMTIDGAPAPGFDTPAYPSEADIYASDAPGRSIQGAAPLVPLRETPPLAAEPAPQSEESGGGLLSDPTVRIGLAFLIGVGLLSLAFLREWTIARRRPEAVEVTEV